MSAYKEKPRWTHLQEEFIRKFHKELTDEEIAHIIGRSKKSITRKRQRMGLEKPCGRIAEADRKRELALEYQKMARRSPSRQ